LHGHGWLDQLRAPTVTLLSAHPDPKGTFVLKPPGKAITACPCGVRNTLRFLHGEYA
jgi:hypothetical protein